ncbi:hypothetical protein F4821DRAFT_265792 [Hypoxylon rubiginosum]|uniref:Uncharacterized protein n=1 Tax=Hypoxylon rubiginosum TaxID=110542 RepID=A0ACC0CJJ8_9PEZI|nr:hypothetical protein F4821DRAFT_265792 [Hypoxylon rubiginosum]
MSSAITPITYPNNGVKIDLAEIRQTGNMGAGVFATQDIPAGTIIFIDTHVLVIPVDESWDGNVSAFIKALEARPSSIDVLKAAAYNPPKFDERERVRVQLERWLIYECGANPTNPGYWPYIEMIVDAFFTLKTNTCEVSFGTGIEGFYPTYSR